MKIWGPASEVNPSKMGFGIIQGSENFPIFSAISQSILNILVQIIYREFSKTLHLIYDRFEGSHFNKDPIFWDTLYSIILYPFYTCLTSKISTHHAADDQQVRHEHRLQERALRQRWGGGGQRERAAGQVPGSHHPQLHLHGCLRRPHLLLHKVSRSLLITAQLGHLSLNYKILDTLY